MKSSLLRWQATALLAFFFWCVAVCTAWAEEFMPVADVKTGMRGIAKTVVVGHEIVTFDVEVLGVMKDRGPSGDLILARFSGPIMEQYGGIAHGMSGSPVYIDGKLVGAVAYGWGFADAKIGMITPIEDMVKLWNVPYEKNLPHPWKAQGEIVPLKTPLMAYGFDGTALAYMKNKLGKYNFETYDTAAGSGDQVVRPLEAGGSVAALLVNGDLKLGAIGTVTYVDKDHVVAFGHPFLKRGAVKYFMHNAEIFTVVKSLNSSFKLGSMGAKVGTVMEDRGAGIAGITDAQTPAIPITISLRDKDTGAYRKAFVNVIEDGDLTPTLAATSVYSLLNKVMDRGGLGTSTVTLELQNRNNKFETLKRTNKFYSATSINEKSIDEMYNIIDVLLNNSFVDYEISDIKVNVEVTKERETAKIMEASASPAIVAPGDNIYLEVKLRPFRGEEVIKKITFQIPKDQPLGEIQVEVRGGGVIPLPYLIEKQKFNLTDEIIRRLKVYKSFDQFYKKLLESDTNNEIVVEILKNGVSMVEGEDTDDGVKAKLQDVEKNPLPGNFKEGHKGVDTDIPDDDEKDEPKAKLSTEYVISGDGQISIQVVALEDRDRMLNELAKKRMAEKNMTKETKNQKSEPKDKESKSSKKEQETIAKKG